ncbi:hypothetical protein [Arthrobacter terrae]|uniref:hypothetical protein n=1 Tax=Arthrobacter terrae TaxID=2935737 RepID=UPI001E2886E3|nr:hypothetical protein [Arthrobacter terrae]
MTGSKVAGKSATSAPTVEVVLDVGLADEVDDGDGDGDVVPDVVLLEVLDAAGPADC